MPKKIPPALARFQKRVKQIQRSTGKSFRSAQKQASAENKGKKKKVSGVRKKSSTRSKSPSRPRMGMVERSTNFKGVLADARKAVHAELGWALAAQRTARTKKEKKGLQPRITELTRQLKALKGE
jgi:transposase